MNALTTKEKHPGFIYRRVSSSLAVCRQLPSHHAPRFKDWSSPRPPFDPFIVEPPRPRISLFIRLMVTFSYPYSPEPIEILTLILPNRSRLAGNQPGRAKRSQPKFVCYGMSRVYIGRG
jgi:hypothetical protein